MITSDTLLIRHLPPDFTDVEKEELLKHFGAVQVKCIKGKIKKNNITFARFANDELCCAVRFKTEEAAKAALFQLHQMDVLGYPLIVEFALGPRGLSFSSDTKQLIQTAKNEAESNRKNYEAFLHRLNAWNSSVNFTQPPPPHLKYQYPPPTQVVLFNISCALASMPKFYTQVLHLMNRMNLPCPFEPVLFPKLPVPDDSLPAADTAPPPAIVVPPQAGESLPQKDSTTEESELESDADGGQAARDIIPEKRTMPQKRRRVKRPKLSQLAGVSAPVKASRPTLKPDEVFEREDPNPAQRRIELRLAPEQPLERQADAEAVESAGGFGLMFPANKKPVVEEDAGPEEEAARDDSCISAEQLAGNRVSSRDQKHLPVFKNYQPGVPSCRLYIKNLARQVEERDLHFIYRRYKLADILEEQGSMFDVRLMKEGRMKGQAFITLQSVKVAEKALEETNGYILKNKPMVVQFARSAKAK